MSNGHILKDPVSHWYGDWEKKFILELGNPSSIPLTAHPIAVSLEKIRASAPDFNPRNYVITVEEQLIDNRIVPSQVDDIDGDGTLDELFFTVDIPAGGTKRLVCWYSRRGTSDIQYEKKTDVFRDWMEPPQNIGWESNLAGYRIYNGQMDYFGKRMDTLMLKSIPTMKTSYHNIADWGMDVLHVGEASGIGGLNIWEDDVLVPVRNPGGKGDISITRGTVTEGPVRAMVRVDFENIISPSGKTYKVQLLLSTFADNIVSRQDFIVSTADADTVVVSPGLVKLPRDIWHIDSQAGVLTNWGEWDPQAREVCMGVMVDPALYAGYADTEIDRHMQIRIPVGERQTYYIVGSWRKGAPSPVAPSPADWHRNVEELARRMRVPVSVECGELQNR